MWERFSSKRQNPELGLFLVRIALALVFIAHGWQKFQNLSGTVAFFDSIGLSALVAYFVATVELLSGLAMLAGIYTRWAGLLLAITMAVAILVVKANMGLVGGYELEVTLLLCSLAMVAAYPRSYGFADWFQKRKSS